MYKECDSSVGDNNEGGASGGGESRGDDGGAGKEQPKPGTAAVQSEKTPHRKRKKHFFTRIRTQMEFYFGDANLSKDRFLNKLLAENECEYPSNYGARNKIKQKLGNVCEYWLFFVLIEQTCRWTHSSNSTKSRSSPRPSRTFKRP